MAQFPTTKGPRRQYHLVHCSQKKKVCDNLYLISRIYVFVHWNGKKKTKKNSISQNLIPVQKPEFNNLNAF